MRFFIYPRMICGYMGFHLDQPMLNLQNVMGLLTVWLNTFLKCMFLLREANTFWDYTNSLYVSLASIVVAVLYTILSIEKFELLKLVDLFEEIFQNSE